MKNKRQIKRRLNSAGNIHQLTKTMEMVAASKMKRAQQLALSSRKYSEMIYEMATNLAFFGEKESKLLKKSKKIEKRLAILISTNKGLCGGLNINLFRYFGEFLQKEEGETQFINLGKKGQVFLRKYGKNLLADFSEEVPWINCSAAIIDLIVEKFLKGKADEVLVVFNSFLSALRYKPVKKRILPIEKLEKTDKEDRFINYIIEPSREKVLERLLPHYLEVVLKSAIYEAEAAEHSARMTAMKNASDNALSLMDNLRLEYNKIRQQSITLELADIITAKAAVKK